MYCFWLAAHTRSSESLRHWDQDQVGESAAQWFKQQICQPRMIEVSNREGHSCYLTCSSSLGKRKFVSLWVSQLRVTHAINLMRPSESMFNRMINQCERNGIQVRRFPISGANLNQLREDLAKLREAVICLIDFIKRNSDDKHPLSLENPPRIAVHCAAGMHRTGLTLYCTLRLIGYSKVHACWLLAQMRMITLIELTQTRRATGRPLIELAETCLSHWSEMPSIKDEKKIP